MKLFKRYFYIIGNRPQTDWRRVLIVSILIAGVALTYSFIFYHQISAMSQAPNEPAVIIEDQNTTSTISTEQNGGKLELEQIIELYLGKKIRFEKMMSELKKS